MQVEAFNKLQKIKARNSYRYGIFAYVLNPNKESNSYGEVIFIAAFKEKEKAREYAKALVVETHFQGIILVQTLSPVELKMKRDSKYATVVTQDPSNEKILELLKAKDEEIERERILKEEIQEEVKLERKEEEDPESLEYYKRLWISIIQSNEVIEQHREAIRKEENELAFLTEKLQKHNKNHPEHDEEFLPWLKAKLEKRKELFVYRDIEKGYKKLRDKTLNGPTKIYKPKKAKKKQEVEEEECEGGVCFLQE